MISALKMFEEMPQKKVQDISFEIALLGRQGFEINDPNKKFRLRALPGEFTALQLVSIMYIGFQHIDPSLDLGMDFTNEYNLALKMVESGISQ